MSRHDEATTGAVDAPRAPQGAGAWDSRSEELLAGRALTPGTAGGPGGSEGVVRGAGLGLAGGPGRPVSSDGLAPPVRPARPDVTDLSDLPDLPDLSGLPEVPELPDLPDLFTPALREGGDDGHGGDEGDSGWDTRDGKGRVSGRDTGNAARLGLGASVLPDTGSAASLDASAARSVADTSAPLDASSARPDTGSSASLDAPAARPGTGTDVGTPSEAVGTPSQPPAPPAPDSRTSAPRAPRAPRPPRRRAVDPVKALMHRHRELCERAVDPLEIAAGLEAHGVTDRAAGRFRHRDVFALAEEMYARVPRDGVDDGAHPDAPPQRGVRTGIPGAPTGWALYALLPGAVCAAGLAGLALTEGTARLVAGTVGALAVTVALRVALRRGPLRAAGHPVPATRAWTCWLLAYALLGDGVLRGVVAGGPDGPGDLWDPALAPLLGLALAVAPAVWCARLFAVRAGARVTASRGLDEFASAVRPLLLGVVALFLAALGTLLAASDALVGAGEGHPAEGAPALLGAAALGALLLLARLLGAYGFMRAPALLLGAAGACEAAALATVFASRLPHGDPLAVPVTAAVDAWGPGVVPATACGAAALALLVHAARTLTLASAHAGPRAAP